MKKTILNLGIVLNNQAQKQIIGGVNPVGSCAYYNGENGEVVYNVTSEFAQSLLHYSSDHWCCNSCNTASWYDGIEAGRQFFYGY